MIHAVPPKYAFEDRPEFWLALGERLVRNARPYHSGKHPRWVAVQDVSGHGSTYTRSGDELPTGFGDSMKILMKRRKLPTDWVLVSIGSCASVFGLFCIGFWAWILWWK
jgi:hypothetical protein